MQYREPSGKAFTALDNLSFTWRQGENIGITGESGSGKSTLARLLIGLETPTKGSIVWNGENIKDWRYGTWRKHRTKIQAVFQDSYGTLNKSLSVYKNMEEALFNLTSLKKPERRQRIDELIALTGTNPELLKTPVKNLSGGEQRRVSLLRALSIRPDYLILDEITSGLDLISQTAITEVLKNFHQKFRCSYMLITHDMKFAYSLSEKIYELSAGKIAKIGQLQK
ncbi:MAG: ATP-binding cassette domain-containing protein [Oscillospiraceae bacterium]